jgi:autotransporter-associated beta strand protein
LALQLGLAGALVSGAGAATKTWDGSSNGDWGVAANWSGSTVPVAGDTLLFPAGISRTSMSNNLPTNIVLSALVYLGSNYTVFGNPIKLTNGITCGQITNQNSITLGLNLTAPQTFQVTNGSAFLVIFGGVDIGTNTLTIDGAGDLRTAGSIVGSGEVHKKGFGQWNCDGAYYSGLTWARAGTTVMGLPLNPVSLQGPVVVGDISDSPFFTDVLIIGNDDLHEHGPVTVGPSGFLQLNDTFNVNSLTVNGGSVLATNNGGGFRGLLQAEEIHATSTLVQQGLGFVARSATITGPVVSFAGLPPLLLDVADGPATPDVFFDGPFGANQLGDFSSMVKAGAGDVDLTGPNSYGGTLTISNGLLRVDDNHGLGTNTVRIAGGTLQLNGVAITNAGALTLDGGPASPGAIWATGGSNLWESFTLFIRGSILLNQAAAHINVDSNSTLRLDAPIVGAGGWTKDGLGTLTLSGVFTNTYSGATTVSGGLMQLAKSAGVFAISGSSLTIGDTSNGTANDTVRYLTSNQISTNVDVFINTPGYST